MTNLDVTETRAEINAKEADLRRSIERLTAPPVDGATIGFGKRIGEGTIQAVQQIADASSAQALNSTLEAVLRLTSMAGTRGPAAGGPRGMAASGLAPHFTTSAGRYLRASS